MQPWMNDESIFLIAKIYLFDVASFRIFYIDFKLLDIRRKRIDTPVFWTQIGRFLQQISTTHAKNGFWNSFTIFQAILPLQLCYGLSSKGDIVSFMAIVKLILLTWDGAAK